MNVNTIKKSYWKPNISHDPDIPLTSQQICMAYSQNDFRKKDFILVDGGRGTGKTDLMLGTYLYQVGQGFGVDWIGIVLRDQFSSLSSIFERAIEMCEGMFDKKSFKVHRSSEHYKIVWNTGEVLMFRHLSSHAEFDSKFKGTRTSWLGLEELTNWEDQDLIEKMKSIVRCPEAVNGKTPPLMIRATTNPDGPGHQSVKENYITDHPSGSIWTDSVVNPFDPSETLTYSYMRIWTNYQENKTEEGKLRLGNLYLASFNKLKRTNYRQWLMWVMGVWDVPEAGAMFEDVLDQDTQAFNDIELPDGTAIYRSFDYGTHDPFSMLYYARMQKGEYVKMDGQYVEIDSDTIIILDEVNNVANLEKPNIGTKMSNVEMIKLILEKEKALMYRFRTAIHPGPSDDFIRRGAAAGNKTPYDDYKAAGIRLLRGVKKAGSIETGIILISERLYATKHKEAGSNKIYISRKAKYLWHMLERLMPEKDNPTRPKPKQADHPVDCLRYVCLERASLAAATDL